MALTITSPLTLLAFLFKKCKECLLDFYAPDAESVASAASAREGRPVPSRTYSGGRPVFCKGPAEEEEELSEFEKLVREEERESDDFWTYWDWEKDDREIYDFIDDDEEDE